MGSIGPPELLIMAVFLVLVAVAIVVVVVAVNSSRAASRNQQLAQVYPAQAMPPAPHSIEARLLELDALRGRGVINDDEHASARKRALEGPTSS